MATIHRSLGDYIYIYGCLMFHSGLVGWFAEFNFASVLADQNGFKDGTSSYK